MKIGIDLDGVIFDSEKEYRNAAELYDIFTLQRNSKIDPTEILISRRYNWTEEEFEDFAKEYFPICSKKCHIIPGAKEVIDILRKEGNEFILITARGGDYPILKELGEELIKRENLVFDKSYWSAENKVEIAKQEGIEIMIEDSIHHCEKFAEAGIRTIYLRDSNLKKSNHPLIKECYLWAEIYRYLKELKEN